MTVRDVSATLNMTVRDVSATLNVTGRYDHDRAAARTRHDPFVILSLPKNLRCFGFAQHDSEGRFDFAQHDSEGRFGYAQRDRGGNLP